MLRPPGAKLRATLLQLSNQLGQPLIIGVLIISRAQEGATAASTQFPMDFKASCRRMHEIKPRGVALSGCSAGIIAKDAIGTFIPTNHIHTWIEEPGWVYEAIHNGLSYSIGDILLTCLVIQEWTRALGQEKQMAALFFIEPQDNCKTFQHLIRNLNVPTLFKPGVPGNAHTYQLCKLFSSEATCASSLKWGKIKLFWMQTSTAAL